MSEVATHLGCSVHKVDYWLKKFSVQKRSRSESMYIKKNKTGDPFVIKTNLNKSEAQLFGLGIGIYWGEGNKKNLHAVRVGNTDPGLVLTYVKFLKEICQLQPEKIRYGLQVFTDVDENEAVNFWIEKLSITRQQIMPTISRINSGKMGTYKIKNRYGVMTVYVFNKKLRDWMVSQLVMPR